MIAFNNDAETFANLTGFPLMLTRLAENIFEGLPNDIAKTSPAKIIAAPRPGADLSHIAVLGNVNRRREQQDAQATLREAMANYGGIMHAKGLTDDQIQRAFWFAFGVDVLSAQALGTRDAATLTAKIIEKIT